MTNNIPNRGLFTIASGAVVSGAVDLRMCAFTGTTVGTDDPDLNFVSDLEAVAGVSVLAERLTLTSVTMTEDDANNRINMDCDAATFSATPGETAQGVAIYREGGGTDATRPLIAVYRDNFPKAMDGGLVVNIADFARGVNG